MASTYTTRIRLEKQGDGENENSWGDVANTVFDLVDEAIAGYVTVTMSSVDVTLTNNSGSSDEARHAFIEIAGAVTESVNLILPAAEKGYFIRNAATVSAGTSITVKTAAGSGINIAASSNQHVICDSVSVFSPNSEGLGLGTAADLNIGTSVNELIPVSSADARYAQLSSTNTFTDAQTFSSTVSVSGTAVFKQVQSPIVTLTDAASVALDMAAGNHFLVTLGGNRTLQNPTNQAVGQVGHIYVVQDGTGGRTLSFGDVYKFVAGTTATLTSVSSSVDLIVFSVRQLSAVDTVIAKNFS
jgi:hypothetical protein